jgi:ABC-type phosphate/phosphonate transport system substrate-binding protein
VVVTIIPDDYTSLVEALELGNAHIVLLDPYAYELAYQQGSVQAAYAVLRNGESKYGAQFLASRRGGFTSYFDEGTDENVDEAPVALAQFADKKPCWSDETSPSGYVIPLGYINDNQIPIKSPAFVEGHPTVVRSLYASGICDFGATYIDARKFPSLEDEFPDLIEQVIVVWQIPAIIPYEVLAFSTKLPPGMRQLFSNLVPAIMQTETGRAAFQTAYGIEELEPANDGYYEEFRVYVDESDVDLTTLVK